MIERALTVLKTLPPNMAVLPQQSPMQIDHTVFYRKQAWLVVQVTYMYSYSVMTKYVAFTCAVTFVENEFYDISTVFNALVTV